MTDLASRLREAKEGSRELDAAVHEALLEADKERSYWQWQASRPKGTAHKPVNAYWLRHAAPVTTDLSAAVALAERVLPGSDWQVCKGGGCTIIYGTRHIEPLVAEGEAATPALALCLAILSAKEKANVD